ncbi:hypothetical protein Tco_0507643 [Tanacetum coccineum]
MQVTLLLLTPWRESHASYYDRIVPKQKYLRNGEDFSYRRRMLPLTYQPMAVKKTSFPEMECGGSIDISIPDAVKDQGEALSDA